MSEKKQIERYLRYGVVRNEEEWKELWNLASEVANTVWPEDIPLDLKKREGTILKDLHKFNVGFLEGCLFQNVLVIMRLLYYKVDKEEIAHLMNVSLDLVNEIAKEEVSSIIHG